jgi:hypothetical protein
MEISKEQVLDLYNAGNHSQGLLQIWFPEAFNVELEIGKWYCHDRSGKGIVNYQGGSSGYGFSVLNNWRDLIHNRWSFETHAQEWRLATTEEWQSALIEEAKKRSYKNGNYECLSNLGSDLVVTNKYYFEDSYLMQGDGINNWNVIFKDGVWAKIIKTFSKEEVEKLLGGKII